MNDYWIYKNFNMVVELDIAGECIYNGIHEIYRIKHFANDGPTFSALYNISVGIERLQKIACVLWCMDDYSDVMDFEKSLITHSHTGLRDRLNPILKSNNVEMTFIERENDFFLLLDNFYNSARYNRFNVSGDWNKELMLLRQFANKYNLINEEMDINPNEYLIPNSKMKEILGRTVGNIARKYYDVIRTGSHKNHTFTYELRSDSKAEKIFLGEYNKNSLMSEQIDESIAYKELLIFFRKTNCKNAFFKFIEDIEPLDFDPPMVLEYLETVIKGEVPQSLIDDVETMYEEVDDKKNRLNLIDLFANRQVDFEYPHVKQGWELLKKIKTEITVTDSDIDSLSMFEEYISEEDLVEIIRRAIDLLKQYINQKISKTDFCTNINEIYDEYSDYIYDFDKYESIESNG